MSYFTIADKYMASPINDKRTHEEHHTLDWRLAGPPWCALHRRREHFTSQQAAAHSSTWKISGIFDADVFAYCVLSPDTDSERSSKGRRPFAKPRNPSIARECIWRHYKKYIHTGTQKVVTVPRAGQQYHSTCGRLPFWRISLGVK